MSALGTPAPLASLLTDANFKSVLYIVAFGLFIYGLSGLTGAAMWNDGGSRETAGPSVRLKVPADQVARTRVFVAAPAQGPTRQDVTFTVRALDQEGGQDTDENFFERPETGQ